MENKTDNSVRRCAKVGPWGVRTKSWTFLSETMSPPKFSRAKSA